MSDTPTPPQPALDLERLKDVANLLDNHRRHYAARDVRDALATIRALQAERDRLREQNRRLREEVNMLVSYGCPVCSGDCASANPPVSGCPMQDARAALAASGEAR